MNDNKKDILKNISPDDKSLLEVLNTSYLSIDDVKWLKSKRWFKRFLKVYSKEQQKRFDNTDNNLSNNISNSNNKELLDYTHSLDVEEEVIEILDFTRTINVTNVKDVVKANEKAKKRIKIEKTIYSIFVNFCAISVIVLLVIIVNWQLENKKINKIVEDIYDVAEVKEETTTTTAIDNESITTTEKSLYTEYGNMSILNVNFNNLLKMNSDTKGWIMVPGTSVNYPFVQTNNNDYYLKHSYDKSSNKKGWVFLDYRNNIDNLSQNNILYAHGLVNNQMFGSLRQTVKSSWYSNKSNHIIKLSTPNSNQLWQVFSTYTIEPEDYYITTSFSSNDEFKKFISTITKRSVYNYKVDITTNDKILTLSSCYSDTKRMVLHAKLIKSD